jgi:hypothetical protein
MRTWVPFLLALLLSARAFALGQGEASLSGGAGVTLAHDDRTRAGAQFELRLLRGVSDAWAARLGVQAGWIPAAGSEHAGYLACQTVGLTWAADVLEWVPFIDLSAAFADLRAVGRSSSQRVGGEIGMGVDYFLSRHTIMSLLGHVDYLPIRVAGDRTTAPILFTLALHVGYVF